MSRSLGLMPFDMAPDLVAEARGFLLDWDGCCAFGNKLLAPAVRFLKANAKRTVIVSNNSSNTPEDLRRILGRAGVAMRNEQIILAGVEALACAVERRSLRTLVLSDARMRLLASRMGVQVTSDRPDLVVLLRDTRFTYSRLECLVNAVANGASVIVANPDVTHPGLGGRIVPETGALLAAVRACVEIPETRLEMIGKPGPRLFLKGCAVLGQDPSSVVMIGDNPATDIAGATALGIHGVLVTQPPERFFRSLVQTLKIA